MLVNDFFALTSASLSDGAVLARGETMLTTDGSSEKKVVRTAACFMGLSHIIYLKERLKGAAYAALEVLFLVLIPFTAKKLYDLVTLGFPQTCR